MTDHLTAIVEPPALPAGSDDPDSPYFIPEDSRDWYARTPEPREADVVSRAHTIIAAEAREEADALEVALPDRDDRDDPASTPYDGWAAQIHERKEFHRDNLVRERQARASQLGYFERATHLLKLAAAESARRRDDARAQAERAAGDRVARLRSGAVQRLHDLELSEADVARVVDALTPAELRVLALTAGVAVA